MEFPIEFELEGVAVDAECELCRVDVPTVGEHVWEE